MNNSWRWLLTWIAVAGVALGVLMFVVDNAAATSPSTCQVQTGMTVTGNRVTVTTCVDK